MSLSRFFSSLAKYMVSAARRMSDAVLPVRSVSAARFASCSAPGRNAINGELAILLADQVGGEIDERWLDREIADSLDENPVATQFEDGKAFDGFGLRLWRCESDCLAYVHLSGCCHGLGPF